MKIMNEFLKLAENLGWSCNVYEARSDGKVCVELEKYSPQGQDFIATIWFDNDDKSDFMEQLYNYYDDFDPDEEAAKWIGEDGHGTNGAPYKLSDLLQDMEGCKDMLLELWHEYFYEEYPDGRPKESDEGKRLAGEIEEKAGKDYHQCYLQDYPNEKYGVIIDGYQKFLTEKRGEALAFMEGVLAGLDIGRQD